MAPALVVALPAVAESIPILALDPIFLKHSGAALAKFEPRRGCYIGAYIDLDPLLKDKTRIDGHLRANPDEFERIVGKQHAMYFFYLGYGRPLPKKWTAILRDKGKFVHVALEPNQGLDKVKNDEYLRELADDMAESRANIFLRFASEMNGTWTAYHGNPAKYREKFRLVHQVMAKYAPNVAMVWCPYTYPKNNIMDYYPGDEYVDWVGVNMYSVTYFNQDPKYPAKHIKPVQMLKYVYETFSHRKPIMICEYGATSYSALERKPVTDFAVSSILSLYEALRTTYTRVKCINYFNGNALLISHRRNNDYCLTADAKVLAAYRRAINHEHFLGAQLHNFLPIPPPPVGTGRLIAQPAASSFQVTK